MEWKGLWSGGGCGAGGTGVGRRVQVGQMGTDRYVGTVGTAGQVGQYAGRRLRS